MNPGRRAILGLGASGLMAAGQKPIYEADFTRPAVIAREEEFIAQSADGIWRRTGIPDPRAEWVAEGWGGAEVRGGVLRVTPAPLTAETSLRSHMVVWNSRIFPESFRLEFEMNPCGSTNGLTIVFFCAAGKNGEDLFDISLPPRRADYPAYHSGAITNYSDAYWSRNTAEESATNRIRRNPGFRLVAEGPSGTLGSTSVFHRVQIRKANALIEVRVNGRVVARWTDPSPLGAGRIGLRSMSGMDSVSYRNLKVFVL